jgi:hypothetical protein
VSASCRKCAREIAKPASQPGPPRSFCDDCAPPSIKRKRGFVVPYTKRREAARNAGTIAQAIERLEPSPQAQRIDALLREVEARIERAQKLIRDAECGVISLRHASKDGHGERGRKRA